MGNKLTKSGLATVVDPIYYRELGDRDIPTNRRGMDPGFGALKLSDCPP
jgi:hypothetical protein